ncbi:hypothetical protein DFQ27_001755, partial [Actinomortierella ambigua]
MLTAFPEGDQLYLPKASFSPFHAAVAALYKREVLPVKDRESCDIDWDKLPEPPFKGAAPALNIPSKVFKQPNLAVNLMTAVRLFTVQWKSFFTNKLAHPQLFNKMCARLMPDSLRFKSLNVDFEERILRPQYAEKDWDAVERCIYDILRLHDFKADLNSALMNPTWIPGEHMEAYCKRIETLYKASGSEPFELRLIRVIHNQLPQNGRDKVLE